MSDPPITIGERVIQPAAPARTRGGQWWLDLPLGRKGALLTIAPWAVTVVVLVSTFVLQRHADDIRDELRIGTTTLVDASLLTEDVGEAEGAVRGYAATGDATMLAPYDAVADRVPDAIAALADGSPPQYADEVATLGDDATAAIAALGTARDAIAPGAADPATAAAALAPATAAVDDFRGTSDGLRAALYAGLTDQADESVRVQDQAQRVLIVGLLLVIATTLAGGAILARSLIGRTVRLSENVKRYSTGDRILPTVAARDEIGQLAEALAGAGNTLSRNQRELTASRDAALAATRAKDVFLSRTSHELRTPLSAIIGFGQLLQMEDLSHDDRESVDHIVSAGRHLLSLIDDVLDIAKIETGAVSMSVEPVVVADVVDEAVALVRAQATERAITLSVAVPPRLAVRADRQRLEQVVLNLLTNAVKYNAHGGRIDVAATTIGPGTGGAPAGGVPAARVPAARAPTVAAPVGGAASAGVPTAAAPVGGAAASGGPDGGGPDGAAPPTPRSSAGGHGGGRSRARLSVADTGIGIAPDQIERLFEPFERLDAAARGIDGTGVGLALSKALVEAMGGRVGMTSTVGEGSTFWCDLDLAVPRNLPIFFPPMNDRKMTGSPYADSLCSSKNSPPSCRRTKERPPPGSSISESQNSAAASHGP